MEALYVYDNNEETVKVDWSRNYIIADKYDLQLQSKGETEAWLNKHGFRHVGIE